MKKKIMSALTIIFLFGSGLIYGSVIEVSQPLYCTANSQYDRNPSIIYDGADYWLFYTKGDDTSTDGVRGPGYNPDADTYVVYYKTASTIAGLGAASETKLSLSESNRPANFDQRVVSAAYLGGDIYAFVSSGQSGTDRGLYYYQYDGSSWSGPVTLIADATARGGHVNVVANGTYVYIVWESSDGSSDCYTWDGTVLSSKIDISNGNQPKITYYEQSRSGNLFVVNIEDGTGDIEVFLALASPNPLFSHHSTAISGAGLYDPCIFNDGVDLYVVTAPYAGADDRQYLIQAKYVNATSTWSAARSVSYGGYGGTYWWDYWPCGYHDGEDAYVFFTTEANSPEYGDGEIAYFKMDWDLDNNHYLYIQNAVDYASSSDTINIAKGLYVEQVVITTEDLTLIGAGRGTDPEAGTIVRSPVNLAYSFPTGSNNNYPVVGIDGVADCLLENLTVDGDNQGDTNYRFEGIGFWNAGGTVANVDVLNIMNSVFSGAQHGVAIYSYNNTGGPYSITLNDVLIDDFQKNAVALLGSNLTVDIDDVTCLGQGPTDVTAQNGIQTGYGASGTVDNCSITGVDYTGGDWTATGLLVYAGNLDASGVSLDQCQTSVFYQDANGTFDNGSITSPSGDGFYAYNSSSSITSVPRVLPQPFDNFEIEDFSLVVFDVDITNSTITGQGTEYSWGVGAYSASTDAINLTVSGCIISSWDYGIYAYDYGGPVNTVIFDNSITSCTYAVGSNMLNTQDASGNWLGTIDYGEVAALFEGDVDYTPWLASGDDTDPMTDGFQGDFTELWIDDSCSQADPSGYLEEGIGMLSGSTVNIAPGTYNESIVFTSDFDMDGLTLTGYAADMPVFSGGVRFLQTAAIDGISFNNLHIKGIAAGGNMIFDMDNSGAVSNFAMDNCIIDGEDISGRTAMGGQNLTGDFSITNTEFLDVLGWAVMDIESGSGDGGSNLPFSSITFANNHVHHCNGSIALRGNSSNLTDLVNVYGNTFNDIGGNDSEQGQHWAAFEVNHADVANIYNNTVERIAEGMWGEGQGIQLWDIGTLDMHDNTLTDCFQGLFVFGGESGGTYGGPYAVPGGSIYHNTFTGCSDYCLAVDANCTGSSLDAEQNYWGTVNCPAIMGYIEGDVDFDPYCNSGYAYCGFECAINVAWVDDDWAGSADGQEVGTNKYYNYNAFSDIQSAVDAVDVLGTIFVAAGEYTEQVIITKDNLSIEGVGAGVDPNTHTIVKSPVNLTYSFNTGSNDNYPVIGVDGVTGVIMSGFALDGDNQGDTNYRFCGIAFWNAAGTVMNCEVRNVMNSTFSGAQHGVGIYSYNNTGGPYTIVLDNILLEDCQKTHVALSGQGLTVDIDDVTTIGEGATGVTAQNGIQVGLGAGGTVDNCTISGFAYTGPTWTASGLLLLETTESIIATDVDIDQCQTSVYFSNANGTFDSGSITNPFGDAMYAFSTSALNSGIDQSKVLPSSIDEPLNIRNDRSPVDVTVSNSIVTGADAVDSWGLGGYAIGPVTFTVTGCEVSHWDWGVIAFDAGGGITSTVHDCMLYDNISYGLYTNDTDVLNAENNWWGAYCGPYHVTSNPNGEGNPVSDNVDYDPWCNDDFTNCSFSVSNPSPAEVWVDDDYGLGLDNDGHMWCVDAFDNIKDGIDAVADYGTIHVGEGIYREQVKIENKCLDLLGAGIGLSVIEAVDVVDRNPYVIDLWNSNTKTIDACVGIVNAGTVDISGFTLDGRDLGPSNFYGVCYYNTNGAVTDCRIEDITCSASPSTSSIVSMLATHGASETITIEFSSNEIPNLQKGGIVTMGPGVTFVIDDNEVTGFTNPNLAPNGIQVSYGSSGSLTGNDVTGVGYPGEDWAGTCILLFECGSVTVTGGNVTGCEMGINHSQWNWIYTPPSTPSVMVDGVNMADNQWSVSTHLANDGVSLDLEVENCTINNSVYTGVDLWGSDQDPWGGSYYSGWTNGTLDANIHDNLITNSAGDAVCENVELATGNTVNCTAIMNSYSGYTDYGVFNNFTNMIDASQCFWGSEAGPLTTLNSEPQSRKKLISVPVSPADELEITYVKRDSGFEDDGLILDGVTANVDYSPWWGDNYVWDDHSSIWNWYLDTSNSSTIMEGVDLALAGDTVFVIPATYTGLGNKNIDFGGKDIVLSAVEDAGNTVIDCQLSGRGFHFHSGESANAAVIGFTIKNGNTPYNGGAVFCENASSPTISQCVIIGNVVNGYGGGIACDGFSDAKIINSTISKNTANAPQNSGGGIYCFDSSPEIKNTIVYENFGAGQNQIYNYTTMDLGPVVTYCDIQGGWPGSSNMDQLPLFRNTDINNPDFHLMSIMCSDTVESPCIDAGHPNILDAVLDCSHGLGTTRSDMGAFGGVIYRTGYEYLPGDANMSTGIWPAEVIGSDVTYLVNYFRAATEACNINGFYCSADANGDCQVIGSDVTKLVNYFRGLTSIDYCPSYVPLWFIPDDLPVGPPAGWPNCDTPVASGSLDENADRVR